MKPGGGKSKGASFERRICKQLSEWWGEKDAFWRTPGSGARGTVSNAIHHFGDISAPGGSSGYKLLDYVSIELKTGYGSGWSPMDMIEGKPATFMNFLKQADRDKKKSKRPFFWLIFQQPRKQIYLCTTRKFIHTFYPNHLSTKNIPFLEIRTEPYNLTIVKFADFLSCCPADAIRNYRIDHDH